MRHSCDASEAVAELENTVLKNTFMYVALKEPDPTNEYCFRISPTCVKVFIITKIVHSCMRCFTPYKGLQKQTSKWVKPQDFRS